MAIVLGYWMTSSCIALHSLVIQYPNTMALEPQYFFSGSILSTNPPRNRTTLSSSRANNRARVDNSFGWILLSHEQGSALLPLRVLASKLSSVATLLQRRCNIYWRSSSNSLQIKFFTRLSSFYFMLPPSFISTETLLWYLS
jgi:hypothetical protein